MLADLIFVAKQPILWSDVRSSAYLSGCHKLLKSVIFSDTIWDYMHGLHCILLSLKSSVPVDGKSCTVRDVS